jgi:Terminase small subunit
MFVSYYLGESQGNATDAARRAGYSVPNVASAKLVVKASIRSAIEAKLTEAAIPAEEVLARLTDHATTSLEDFVRIDKRKRLTIDFARAKELGRLHCVKKLRRGKYGWELELYDAQAALVQLGKYHGLFDRIDLSRASDKDLESHTSGSHPKGDSTSSGGGKQDEPGNAD